MCVLFVYLLVVLGLTEWLVELLSNYTSLDQIYAAPLFTGRHAPLKKVA